MPASTKPKSKSPESRSPQAENKEEAANDDDNNEQTPSNEEENAAGGENKEEVEENKDKGENEETIEANSILMKCYAVLIMASAINLVAAADSDHQYSNRTITQSYTPASAEQKEYALAAAGLTGGIAIICLIGHFDRFTCLTGVWKKLFGPKVCFEKYLLFALVIFLAVTTWLHTRVNGIAGDGKRQYNLYFSTWIMLLSAIWTLERWFVASGHSSLHKFLYSWPFRAPAWILFFASTLANFLFVIELHSNWEEAFEHNVVRTKMFEAIPEFQWTFLMIIALLSCLVSAVFSLVEICRFSRAGIEPQKATWESMVEGGSLLILSGCWAYCVGYATTPGGLGSFIGNTYFCTWFDAIMAMRIFVWWLQDWRMDIYNAAEKQVEEYEKAKKAALAKGAINMEEGASSRAVCRGSISIVTGSVTSTRLIYQ